MGDCFITDNGLNRAVPGAINAVPDLDTDSQNLTNAAADTDTQATVVGGRSYLLVPVAGGGFYAGYADATQAANVKYAAPLGSPGIVINVPLGKTTLHYATTANGGKAKLIPLVRQ